MHSRAAAEAYEMHGKLVGMVEEVVFGGDSRKTFGCIKSAGPPSPKCSAWLEERTQVCDTQLWPSCDTPLRVSVGGMLSSSP
eukprot:scaffold6595_cov24-Tisochrysis_lutea.AAC.3